MRRLLFVMLRVALSMRQAASVLRCSRFGLTVTSSVAVCLVVAGCAGDADPTYLSKASGQTSFAMSDAVIANACDAIRRGLNNATNPNKRANLVQLDDVRALLTSSNPPTTIEALWNAMSTWRYPNQLSWAVDRTVDLNVLVYKTQSNQNSADAQRTPRILRANSLLIGEVPFSFVPYFSTMFVALHGASLKESAPMKSAVGPDTLEIFDVVCEPELGGAVSEPRVRFEPYVVYESEQGLVLLNGASVVPEVLKQHPALRATKSRDPARYESLKLRELCAHCHASRTTEDESLFPARAPLHLIMNQYRLWPGMLGSVHTASELLDVTRVEMRLARHLYARSVAAESNRYSFLQWTGEFDEQLRNSIDGFTHAVYAANNVRVADELLAFIRDRMTAAARQKAMSELRLLAKQAAKDVHPDELAEWHALRAELDVHLGERGTQKGVVGLCSEMRRGYNHKVNQELDAVVALEKTWPVAESGKATNINLMRLLLERNHFGEATLASCVEAGTILFWVHRLKGARGEVLDTRGWPPVLQPFLINQDHPAYFDYNVQEGGLKMLNYLLQRLALDASLQSGNCAPR